MNSVERAKSICRERKIPISKLEKDLGYANGYIGQLRKGVFPDDRLVEIAEYLAISVDYLLTGEDTKKAPTPEGEREIGFDDFTYAMQNETKELTKADKALLLSMARQLNDARKTKDGESD
ncbi:MAG: helix-turn-helix transcriptional regulator [Bacillota bacterium]